MYLEEEASPLQYAAHVTLWYVTGDCIDIEIALEIPLQHDDLQQLVH
jgi:hypothetical protein